MNARIVAGSIAGMLGALIVGLGVHATDLMGFTTIQFFPLISMVFLPASLAYTNAGNLYGLIIHLISGAVIGIIYIYLLSFTNDDILLYKGVLLGGITWLVMGGFISNILGLPIQSSLVDMTVMAIGNLIFAVITVFSAIFLRARYTT